MAVKLTGEFFVQAHSEQGLSDAERQRRALQKFRSYSEAVWVRPKEGARMLGCGLTKFYELLNSGKIESIRVDGMRLVRVASIKAPGSVG
jgi:excisionase family DNA binding protein